MKDIKPVRMLIALNGNKRLIHYEKEIFTNKSLTRAYIRQLFNINRLCYEPSRYLFEYARDHIKGRWVEAESCIFDSAETSYYYMRYAYNHGLLQNQFKSLAAAEKIVLRDPWFSYLYARDIINGRWDKAEQVILDDPVCAFQYLTNVVKYSGEWLEGELFVRSNGFYEYW